MFILCIILDDLEIGTIKNLKVLNVSLYSVCGAEGDYSIVDLEIGLIISGSTIEGNPNRKGIYINWNSNKVWKIWRIWFQPKYEGASSEHHQNILYNAT